MEKQNQINATFDLFFLENANIFDKTSALPPIQKPEITIKDFKSTLNEKQMELIVECINEIKVLESDVTIDIVK